MKSAKIFNFENFWAILYMTGSTETWHVAKMYKLCVFITLGQIMLKSNFVIRAFLLSLAIAIDNRVGERD